MKKVVFQLPTVFDGVFQVLARRDVDEIYDFAFDRHQSQGAAQGIDATELTFQTWSARWRKESLEHYLPLGWSFVARENGKAVGFFLGQPFIFFRGQTQTLWIEHIEARDEQVRDALMDVAVRTAREKHLQRVVFAPENVGYRSGIETLRAFAPSVAPIGDSLFEVRTTKG